MVVERNAEVSYRLMREDGYRYLVVAEPNDGDHQPARALALVERARHSHLWDRGLRSRAAGVAVRRDRRCERDAYRCACCAAGFGSPAGNRRGSRRRARHADPPTRPVAEHASQRVRRARTASCEESHPRRIRAHERRSADDQVLRSGVAHTRRARRSEPTPLLAGALPAGPRHRLRHAVADAGRARPTESLESSRVRSRTPLIAELRVLEADIPGRARLAAGVENRVGELIDRRLSTAPDIEDCATRPVHRVHASTRRRRRRRRRSPASAARPREW